MDKFANRQNIGAAAANIAAAATDCGGFVVGRVEFGPLYAAPKVAAALNATYPGRVTPTPPLQTVVTAEIEVTPDMVQFVYGADRVEAKYLDTPAKLIIHREVTPRMIAAGVEVLEANEAAINSGAMSSAEFVTQIFGGMRAEQMAAKDPTRK